MKCYSLKLNSNKVTQTRALSSPSGSTGAGSLPKTHHAPAIPTCDQPDANSPSPVRLDSELVLAALEEGEVAYWHVT